MTAPETREMYGEIATLIASIAQALSLTDAEVIAALERGEVAVEFGEDANGNRYVMARHQGREARIYQGAIKHPGDSA